MEYNTSDKSTIRETIGNRKVLLFRLMLDLKITLSNLKTKLVRKFSPNGFSRAVKLGTPVIVEDPFKKLVRQAFSFGGALLIVMSFATHGPETGFSAEYSSDATDGNLGVEDVSTQADAPFMVNDEGFVLKSSPATEDVSRIGFNDYIKHTIVSGETLASIASLYGVSSQTVMWENGLTEDSILNIGQTLMIPPVNGISYVVTSKDTVESIAKDYSVDPKIIREHNNLSGDLIAKGQKLFIPGAKKKVEEQQAIIAAARTGTRSSGRTYTGNTFQAKVVVATNDGPSSGKTLIFPTNGKITQGFHSGHYANDIGNSSQPDIWAAAAGTVVLAKGGCPERDDHVDRSCNGGYGNYVIVDHGNGLQTLYGHMQTLYVSEGQSVVSGQAVGKMGNSGRTYGPTGIHLHFEVRVNGEKKNPENWF